MVITLEVRRFLDLEAFDHGLQVFSFRLLTWAQFKCSEGWTSRMPALIDTGAPFSVLPKSLWMCIESEARFTTSLRGLVPLPFAVLKASLGRVTCLVSDPKSSAPPLSVWALLAEGEVPLVLGCAGFLERATLLIDGPRRRASLEF